MEKELAKTTGTNLTHVNERNNPVMVDVGGKVVTHREALASGTILMSDEAFDAVIANTAKKGPVINTAIVAGILAAKNTAATIPMCHPLFISHVNIEVTPLMPKEGGSLERKGFVATAVVKVDGITGVEMEALHAVSVTLLTMYDMLKAIDKSMEIGNICLDKKSGGKSGEYVNPRHKDA